MALTAQEQAELDNLELEQLEQEYARSNANASAAPTAPAPTKKAVPAVEEMHPDVSWSDRAIVKNFAQSPETGAGYLNQQGFETEIRNGNIYVRKPNEDKFKALDPSGFDVQDITDMGFDIPAGVATGAATAAGGLALNIPGAIGAGAASSSGLEGLRQGIGKYLGIPQDISGKDMAVAGALGGASPILFGTGATAAQMLKSGVIPSTQRSLVTKGIEKAFPYVGRASSGVPVKAIKTYMQETGTVDALIKQGPDVAAQISNKMHGEIKEQFFQKKKEIGEALSTQIKGGDNLIPTSAIFAPLAERHAELVASQRFKTPSGKAEAKALKKTITGLLKGLPVEVTPNTAWELQDTLKQLSNYNNVKGTMQSRFGPSASGAEKTLADAAAKAYKNVNQELENAAGAAGLKKEYTDASRLQEKLQKYFNTPEATERTLMSLDAKSKGAARKTVSEFEKLVSPPGANISKQADLLNSYSYFQDPELLPISSGGTTSTSRSIGISSAFEALGGLAGPKGAQVGRATGNVLGGPAAIKQIVKKGKTIGKALGAGPARTSPWLQMGIRDEGNK